MGYGDCWNDEIFALTGSLERTTLDDRTEDPTIGQAAGLDLSHLEQLPKILPRVQLDL